MNDKPVVTVAFADDHLMVRKALKIYLEQSEKVKVIIEASNGRQMLRLLENAASLPDICIIDIAMPELNGPDLLKAIKIKWPSIRTLAVTAHDHHPLVLRMISYGVNGYLLKSSDPDVLIEAVLTIHNIGYYYSEMADKATFQAVHSNKLKLLQVSDMELAVLQCICMEITYEQIAEKIGTDVQSVNNARKRLFEKFRVSSRTSLAIEALHQGIITIPIH